MIQENFLIESISEINLKKNILKSNFILKYIDHIKPLSYKLNIPNERDITIRYPIILEYFDKPKFNGFNFLMPKLRIIQRWDLLDYIIAINIDIFANNSIIAKVNINISYKFISKDLVNILITGKWIEKSFIVPSRILENIISETKDFIILALK